MLPTPTYRLLSLQSDIERPRVLKIGSLAACLDELKEAVLVDVVACNRSVLRITATQDDAIEPQEGGRRGRIVDILTATTTGDQL